MSDTDSLVLKAAALKVFSEYTKARYDDARAELSEVFNPGDRLISRSPLDNTKIGAVYMTDPKPECRVTDMAAFKAWMFANYPELCENGYEIIGSEKEVVDALWEHAPHLLRRVHQVTAEALRELRAAAVTLGQVVGPGGEAEVPGLDMYQPAPVVTCRPTEDALQAVMDMHRAGQLDLDGTVHAPQSKEA